MDRVALILATGGYVGYSPWASGTAGSLLLGIPLVLLLGAGPVWVYGGGLAVLVGVGLWASHRAESLLGEKDSGHIVVDEVAGMAATMFLVPLTFGWVVAGFLLFRVLDVVKPFPIRLAEQRLPGGVGVMGDDLLAALYANLVLQVVRLMGVGG